MTITELKAIAFKRNEEEDIEEKFDEEKEEEIAEGTEGAEELKSPAEEEVFTGDDDDVEQ